MSRVVLIRPPMVLSKYSLSTSATPPLALAYLSATLRANGIVPQTIDALGEDTDRLSSVEGTAGIAQGLPIEEIVARINDDADIIGYSSMFSCAWTYDKKILAAIRARFPDALIVAGGEHITACPEYVLKDSAAVDLCVTGEGEESMLAIVQAVNAGEDPRLLDGVVSLDGDAVWVNPPRARIRDIDNIPEPYWDDLPLETYMSQGLGHGVNLGRSMPLLATRGCPFQCTFCSSPFMWTTRWQARSPQLVFDEMVKYIEKYDVQNFDLYDLTAIVKKSWTVEFCDIILESGREFTWQLPSGTRSEAIDDEVVDKLWRSGCRNMNYAPESGSPEVLKRIKKKVKLPRLIESLQAAVKRGLNVKMNMIFGFPEDSPREMWQSYLFGMKCAWLGVEDSTFVPFVPYPGSELYGQLVADGTLEPMSDDYFNSLIPHSDLEHARSFNPHLSDRQLVWARYLYFALFYGTMFIRWPNRPVRIIYNLMTGNVSSRGEEILRNILQRRKMLRRAAP